MTLQKIINRLYYEFSGGKPPVPKGPIQVKNNPKATLFIFQAEQDLLYFSKSINLLTGNYGYSHVSLDIGEIDEDTGKNIMIESMPGGVTRSFQDEYGDRKFVKINLEPYGIDYGKFSECVKSKLGDPFDWLGLFTFGNLDEKQSEVCVDVPVRCFPQKLTENIIKKYNENQLPKNSVMVHHLFKNRVLISPNALAKYFGAPNGKDL